MGGNEDDNDNDNDTSGMALAWLTENGTEEFTGHPMSSLCKPEHRGEGTGLGLAKTRSRVYCYDGPFGLIRG